MLHVDILHALAKAVMNPGSLQRLTETKGLSEAKVEKALEAAKKMCANYGWQSATQIGVQVLSPVRPQQEQAAHHCCADLRRAAAEAA